jgi:MFS transporter, BCD family, chlorophyll transporter
MISETAKPAGLGWIGILRLGAVQAAIGAIVMLATSLLNRVMVVEFKMAAAIPAGLVAWHYAVQLSRPLWGYKSDHARARTPWIIGGMGILALGTVFSVDAAIAMSGGASLLSWLMAIVGFTMIGIGVGIAGTSLLALLASRVAIERKPAAAAITWTMMVFGVVVAAGVSGSFLDPFTHARLAIVSSFVVLAAFCVAVLALRNLEERSRSVTVASSSSEPASFGETLGDIWKDQKARRFTLFVFISMLAYSMQDLILEPFAGFIFRMTPGQSTQMSSVQHGGVLFGMLAAGWGGSVLAKRYGANPKLWILLGCMGSALMLVGLSFAAKIGLAWPLKANVFCLGVTNGVFAVAAVGAMLGLASDGKTGGEGARLGVWGASQAVAFGLGGLLGAVIVDQLRSRLGVDDIAFQTVFVIEAAMFVLAGWVAVGTSMKRTSPMGQAIQA